jgi:DNA-binding CsgD family transcriptional regulator
MPVATRWPLVGRRDELDRFTRALADPGCQALCIYGPPGVGKTRLADECLDLAVAAGRRGLRAAADRAGGEIPFGPIVHLLPSSVLSELRDDGATGPGAFARLLDGTRDALAPAAGESGVPVLVLDDAHGVDDWSLRVIDRLLAGGLLFCIATIVGGEAAPETVVRWWRDERGIRVDLADLDPIGVDTLLHVALEGPLDGAASAELWRASHGNVLALRELVLGAQEREALVRRDGTWFLDGPLPAPDRLRELVEVRLAALEPPAQDVLDLLALCEPLGLGQLEAAAGLTVLEGLERHGLIVVQTDGRRESVRLAHPTHGDVLRARLPVLRRRSILLRQAETVEAWGARRREDATRIATWRLEATGRGDPDLLLQAARLARYGLSWRQAERLARAALASQPSAAAGLVLGESLYNLGSFDEAEEVLSAASARAVGDEEVVRIATVRRRNLMRGCRRQHDAVAVGRDALSRVVTADAQDELRAGEAEVLSLSGRPQEALAILDDLEPATPRLRVLAAIPRAQALALTGRTAEAIDVARRAAREHQALGDELAISSPGTHRVNLLFALTQAGRLGEAEARARPWFEVAAGAGAPLGVIWITVHLARCALARGLPETALGWSARACAAIDTSGLEGLRPAALAVAAAACGLRGDAAAAAARADEADAAGPGFGLLASEQPLGRAWALVAAGEIAPARSLLLAAAADAEGSGHVPAAAWLLHDAARLGAAAEAAPRLATLSGLTDSELVAARAAHAAAVVARDAPGLDGCAERFETLGALVLAAESAAAAADEWRRRRDQRRAVASDRRADDLEARCEGARPPALVRASGVVPLTDREREIAALAAAGCTSRVIAERLYLSVRTVDNHLGRVYDKLGVSSRAELAERLQRYDR